MQEGNTGEPQTPSPGTEGAPGPDYQIGKAVPVRKVTDEDEEAGIPGAGWGTELRWSAPPANRLQLIHELEEKVTVLTGALERAFKEIGGLRLQVGENFGEIIALRRLLEALRGEYDKHIDPARHPY